MVIKMNINIKDYCIKNKQGFSLIELMVVVTILGFIILGLVTFFTGGTKSWVTGQSQLTAQRNARQAMDQMIREIREGEKLLNGSDRDTIIVHFPDSFGKSDITYNFNLLDNTIYRDSNPLINNVNDLSFTYFDNDGDPIAPISASRVQIDLQVDVDKDGKADLNLKTEVSLRNFGL